MKDTKKKNYTKGKKSPSRKGKHEETGKIGEMGQSITNDIAWYAHYPELTLNAGKLSMLYPAGAKINFLKDDATIESNVHDVPGVMAIEYVPTYGYSDSLSAPLTRMSRSLFNNMVAQTNRVPSYEYTDLTMYQLAMTNLIQFYYWASRIYLVAGTYDAYNVNWNRAIFKAMKVDGYDIIMNKSLLYSYLINFAHRIAAFPFPKEFSLFDRTAQLASTIYADGEGPKSQIYFFNPRGGYVWDNDLETGSKLTYFNYNTSNTDITYNRIVEIGEELLAAISGSSDVQLMTSDILKVYAATLVKVNPVPENGTIAAVYDPVVMTQLMNARFVGNLPSELDITQATDGSVLEPYLIAKPIYAAEARTKLYNQLRPMVNFLIPNPSEGTVLEGTRFMFTEHVEEETTYIDSFGSELLTMMRIVTSNGEAGFVTYTFGNSVLIDDANGYKLLGALTAFDWHPRVAVFDEEYGEYLGHFWDCSNYAILTEQQVQLMNNTALANLMLIYG